MPKRRTNSTAKQKSNYPSYTQSVVNVMNKKRMLVLPLYICIICIRIITAPAQRHYCKRKQYIYIYVLYVVVQSFNIECKQVEFRCSACCTKRNKKTIYMRYYHHHYRNHRFHHHYRVVPFLNRRLMYV